MRRLTFGLLAPLLAPTKVVDTIVRLEALGFDRVWMPDHILYPDPFASAEAWTVLAAAAMRTTRIELATAVSDPHRTHPAVLAQRVATLDQLSGGRVVVGLGAGEAMNLVPFGIPWDRPVSRLTEFITVFRGLLDSSDPLNFEGRYFQVRQARLAVRPWEGRHVPLYLAALGPRMQRLAGTVADGWLPVAIPPDQYEEYFSPVHEAAMEAGRGSDAIERVALVSVSLTEDVAQVDRFLRVMGLTLVWPDVLRRLGVSLGVSEHLAHVSYASVNPCDDASVAAYRELMESLPMDVMRRFVIHGTVEQVRERLAAYLAAGVTHFTILDGSPDPKASARILGEQVLPWLRERGSASVAVQG